MPLVFFALASYIAGLYGGFADSAIVAPCAVVTAAFVGAPRGRFVALGFAALAGAGVVIARATEAGDARCLDVAAHSAALRLTIADSVAPGDFTRARLDACEASVGLSVRDGAARPGASIVVRGEVVRAQHGLMIQHASVVSSSSGRWLPRLRAAIGRAIDADFGGDAPLVRALLIADTGDLSPDVRNAFAAAGLTHILAVSGSHIAIIALALAIGFELAGVRPQPASVATLVVAVFYVALIGAPVAAVRSLAMIAVHLVTKLTQRPTSRWAIVALGAGHAVVAPRVVLDAGYQLSVVGAASIIAASLLVRRLRWDGWPNLARMIVVALLGTVVASIGSAPIVAWTFGRLSVIGPVSNLLAAPIVALLQPLLFLGMLALPVPPLARFVADAAHPLVAAFDAVARHSASVPHASIDVAPSVVAALVAGAMSCAVIVACASREWERPAVASLVAAAALAWMPNRVAGSGELEVHMLDVGQGDAIALRTPHGHWILVDAGGAWRGGDAGRSTVLPYIGRRGGPVDLFVLSHPHTDHVGGAATALRVLRPGAFIDAGFPGAADAYRAALGVARDTHVRWRRAHPGDEYDVDGVALTVLAPDSVWTSRLDDPNLASVVLLARYGAVRVLLMGDAERAEEEWLLEHAAAPLRADILKVGHHGSRTSSSERFLAAVRPRLALVSVGAGNVYHLPTPMIIDRLAAGGAQVLRTDRLGTIVARTDGRRIRIAAAGDEWDLLDAVSTP